MALSETIEYQPGDTRPLPQEEQKVIFPVAIEGEPQYWHINTSWRAGELTTRFPFGVGGMKWFPIGDILGYAAKGKLQYTLGQYSRILLFDWGQSLHFQAESFTLWLVFPRDTLLTSFTEREQFAAQALPAVAGEGGEPIYLTEGRIGQIGGTTSDPRPIPWDADELLFMAARNNPLSPDPLDLFVDLGYFDGVNFFPMHTIEYSGTTQPISSGVRLGAEEGIATSYANSFRVRVITPTSNWTARWRLSPP